MSAPYGKRSLEILRHLSAGPQDSSQIAGALEGVKKATVSLILKRLWASGDATRTLRREGVVLLRPGVTRKKRSYVYEISDQGIARLNRALVRDMRERKDRRIH